MYAVSPQLFRFRPLLLLRLRLRLPFPPKRRPHYGERQQRISNSSGSANAPTAVGGNVAASTHRARSRSPSPRPFPSMIDTAADDVTAVKGVASPLHLLGLAAAATSSIQASSVGAPFGGGNGGIGGGRGEGPAGLVNSGRSLTPTSLPSLMPFPDAVLRSRAEAERSPARGGGGGGSNGGREERHPEGDCDASSPVVLGSRRSPLPYLPTLQVFFSMLGYRVQWNIFSFSLLDPIAVVDAMF